MLKHHKLQKKLIWTVKIIIFKPDQKLHFWVLNGISHLNSLTQHKCKTNAVILEKNNQHLYGQSGYEWRWYSSNVPARKSDEEKSALISKPLFIKAMKELLTQNFQVKIFVGGNLELTVQNWVCILKGNKLLCDNSPHSKAANS